MLNAQNFDYEIIAKKATAMLIFTADWCRPSSLQKPVVQNLMAAFSPKVIIEIIDVDQQPELADRFFAKTLPTTILFADGEIVEALPGYQSEEFLTSYLQHILDHLEKPKEKA